MDIAEIFLNRLSDNNEIWAEVSEKLGVEKIGCNDELTDVLMGISDKMQFRIYISDEDIPNELIDSIRAVFINAAECSSSISVEFFTDEFVNIIDENDRITSRSKPRTLVHRDGDLHPTVHVWMIKRKDMGIYVLLQKRSHEKAIYPDCYDVSAAGHVTQSGEFGKTAVREIKEELGLDIPRMKLEFIGFRKNHTKYDDICDNELSAVYLCREPIYEDQLVLQLSEVSEVCWAEIDEILSIMDDGTFPNCISADELKMIKKAVF